jgi:hypothetical protein
MVRKKGKKRKKGSVFDKAVKTVPPSRHRTERKMERGIKMPPPRRNEVYSWSTMRIGDSFTVDIDLETRRRAQVAASTYKRRHPGWRYATRLEHENGVMRVWRIA